MTATTLPDGSSTTGATATSENVGQMKTFMQNVRKALAEMGDPLSVSGKIQNLSLVASVAGSALTIAVKDRAGADPTATEPASPASVSFRNPTVGTGDHSVLNVTAASSLVISSGSTMGARNGIPFRLWIVAFNDGGTWRIGAINCVTTVAGAGAGSDVTKIYPLAAWGIAGSTAEGGAGGADNAQTFYTGSAVSAKAFVVLGYMTWESGLTTAGTWDAAPTRIQLFGPGVPLPGQLVQVQRNDTGAVATGTTQVPNDDTIPQNTEGDQYMSQAITPSSAANVLDITHEGCYAGSSINQVILSLYQDTTANALATKAGGNNANANYIMPLAIRKKILSAGTASTTFKIRAGLDGANTLTFNGGASARKFGGVMGSFLEALELQG